MTTSPDTTAIAPLLGVLRRFVGRRIADPHAAEDLVQDVLLEVAQRFGGAGGQALDDDRLRAFVLAVARNAVIDHYRTRRKQAELPADLAAEGDDELLRLDLGPLRASFRAFLHGLPPEQRESLLLVEYEGLSQQQLAERLGVAPSTVKSRVQRGRARLKRALLACCEFEFDARGAVVDWQQRPGGGCRECR